MNITMETNLKFLGKIYSLDYDSHEFIGTKPLAIICENTEIKVGYWTRVFQIILDKVNAEKI